MQRPLEAIKKHYQSIANAISDQLQIETPNHHVTSGTSRELIWLEVFTNMVPKKFKLEQSVFIIDSFGEVSAEVDIAIYDEQYTPYVFNYGCIKFIPIEAVSVAIQSKSRSVDVVNVISWAQTIYKLQPQLDSYTRLQTRLLDTMKDRAQQLQVATRPILILCSLDSFKTPKRNDEKLTLAKIERNFDFVLHLDEGEQFQVKVNAEREYLEWFKQLNRYRLDRYGGQFVLRDKDLKTDRTLEDLNITGENSLLTFKMQLNQLLMLINNPTFFPHRSYANMFNKALNEQVRWGEVEEMKKCEKQFLLAVYDITGIQDYIFASNRMKENMGGSYIVGQLVEQHFVKVLKNCAGKNPVRVDWETYSKEGDEENNESVFNDKKIEAEIVYIGGGNVLVIYRDWALYNKVNKAFALEVIVKSASLTMVTEAIPFTLDKDTSYVELRKKLMQKLAETKATQTRTKLNQTLPIFAQEPFKGEPITHSKNDELISTEQYLKREATSAGSYFEKFGEQLFAKETEDLKKNKGEDSYIAVVHIDGNGMGVWLDNQLQEAEKAAESDSAFRTTLQTHRGLSLQITAFFRNVFEKTVAQFTIRHTRLPLRPLILDGDDFTFICQGDLVIPFTQAFLKQLEVEKEEFNFEITACAGAAFVHSHFPFELAYEIAEQCCQNAKNTYYKDRAIPNTIPQSYFDFYLVRGSYVKIMDEQRKSQTYLEDQTYNVENLGKLQSLIRSLNHSEERWPHSRLVALYEAYLQDESDAVQLVKSEAASRGYKNLINNEDSTKENTKENTKEERMLFDALQLMDFGKGEGWEY